MAQYATSQEDFEKYRIQYELFLFDDATQSIATAVRNLDPLITACVSSTVEYVDVAVFYAYTFQQPKKLLYNVIYDMGEIYDNAVSLYYLSQEFETMDNSQIKAFGTSVGRLFNMLFYDPEDFETYEESVSKINNIRTVRRNDRNNQ